MGSIFTRIGCGVARVGGGQPLWQVGDGHSLRSAVVDQGLRIAPLEATSIVNCRENIPGLFHCSRGRVVEVRAGEGDAGSIFTRISCGVARVGGGQPLWQVSDDHGLRSAVVDQGLRIVPLEAAPIMVCWENTPDQYYISRGCVVGVCAGEGDTGSIFARIGGCVARVGGGQPLWQIGDGHGLRSAVVD